MSTYPQHVKTVEEATDYIKMIFHHPDIRVERYSVEVVTPKGGTMKLTWDRKDVGQRRHKAESRDGPGERDPAFQETLEGLHKR